MYKLTLDQPVEFGNKLYTAAALKNTIYGLCLEYTDIGIAFEGAVFGKDVMLVLVRVCSECKHYWIVPAQATSNSAIFYLFLQDGFDSRQRHM